VCWPARIGAEVAGELAGLFADDSARLEVVEDGIDRCTGVHLCGVLRTGR